MVIKKILDHLDKTVTTEWDRLPQGRAPPGILPTDRQERGERVSIIFLNAA